MPSQPSANHPMATGDCPIPCLSNPPGSVASAGRRGSSESIRARGRHKLAGMELAGAECGMRALSLAFAATAALLVGLDRETETVIFIRRTATVRDLTALWVMTVTASVAAGYHLLQLCGRMASAFLGRSSRFPSKLAAWLQFLLDQGAAYATFLATMAGLQGSLVGVFGVHKLQWMKLCNVYGRFCKKIGGGVACALVAALAMAIVAAISARRLFKLYSRAHRRGCSPSK